MDGILIVDKPKEWTSHDVVAFIRRRFKIKKVGHAGTLDPMATGVLVILLGKATRLSKHYMSAEKEYLGSLILGVETDTADARGKVVEKKRVPSLDDRRIEEAFRGFIGEIEQTPPMYSAVRSAGRKLYEFARKGIMVERKARRVLIKELKIIRVQLPEVSFRMVSSPGTYVRALAADIGKALGCGAHLNALKRLRSGAFRLENAVKMEELEKMSARELANFVENVSVSSSSDELEGTVGGRKR